MKVAIGLNLGPRRALARGLAGLAGAAALLVSWPAAANGRFPAANQIVFSPSDPEFIVLRASYGIIPSHDNGITWQFLCEDAIGVPPNSIQDPSIALTDKSLLAGASIGLSVSSDVGCNWSCQSGALAGQAIADLAVRPDAPSSAVAITDSYTVQADSGQELALSQVFETTDNGATWTALGAPIDPNVAVTTIDVTKTDPSRLYVSGTRGFGPQRTASLFVSKDKGQSWAEWPLPAGQFDPTAEESIFIGGVDPTNADHLYIRSSGQAGGGQSRLLNVALAADGTPTFSTTYVFNVDAGVLGFTGQMLGFALSPDGAKVYIGSVQDGLWVAQTSDMVFHQTSSIAVQCLATRGAELWACSSEVHGFIAAVSTDDGKTFTSKLPTIGTLAGPIACAPNATGGVACGASANASQCASSYELFCELNTCNSPDASDLGDASRERDASQASDGAHDAGTSRSGPRSSCNLGVVGAGGRAALGVGFALVGLALRRRRRR